MHFIFPFVCSVVLNAVKVLSESFTSYERITNKDYLRSLNIKQNEGVEVIYDIISDLCAILQYITTHIGLNEIEKERFHVYDFLYILQLEGFQTLDMDRTYLSFLNICSQIDLIVRKFSRERRLTVLTQYYLWSFTIMAEQLLEELKTNLHLATRGCQTARFKCTAGPKLPIFQMQEL